MGEEEEPFKKKKRMGEEELSSFVLIYPKSNADLSASRVAVL